MRGIGLFIPRSAIRFPGPRHRVDKAKLIDLVVAVFLLKEQFQATEDSVLLGFEGTPKRGFLFLVSSVRKN